MPVDTRARLRVPSVQLEGGADRRQRIAVDVFMHAVQRLRPEAIDEFAAGVVDDLVAARRAGPKQPSDSFAAWCRQWNLLPARSAVFGWALRTRTQWASDPNLKSSRRWKTVLWGSSSFNRALWDEYPNTNVLEKREPADPLEAFPELESRHDFLERAGRHWTARVASLQQAHSDGVDAVTERHFEWLARYQVGRETFSQIARDVGSNTKQETVSKGVRAAAEILGVKPRTPSRDRRSTRPARRPSHGSRAR
jgi:hypothetical protein